MVRFRMRLRLSGRACAIIHNNKNMKKFSEYKIIPKGKFIGDKIKITKVLNKEVELHDFKIVDSKFEKEGVRSKCLYLQVRISEELFVIFSGSKNLIEMIEQLPREDLPILVTIIKNGEQLEFN